MHKYKNSNNQETDTSDGKKEENLKGNAWRNNNTPNIEKSTPSSKKKKKNK